MVWNTFLGSNSAEAGGGIGLDGGDNVYITGYGDGTWGNPIHDFTAVSPPKNEAFVAKLNNEGAILWNTFLGGDWHDMGDDCTVDEAGNVYVTGYSGATWGTPIQELTGGNDAFVAKLNTEGARQWHTFIGGEYSDNGYSIKLNDGGKIYVTGASQTSWGEPANQHVQSWDAFIAILNADGTPAWNTFLGGLVPDKGLALTLDRENNVYATGISEGTWGEPVNPFVEAFGVFHTFVAKLAASPSIVICPDYNQPNHFALHQNYPNPFNPETTIAFRVPDASQVSISIYDMNGRKITDLFEGRKETGVHTLKWNAMHVPSGVYFIKMQAGRISQMRKCVLMK